MSDKTFPKEVPYKLKYFFKKKLFLLIFVEML